ERDRMVKRLISAGARSYPAGMARLSDEPVRHLLVVVDEGVADAETIRGSAARSARDEAGSHHDHWYFSHEDGPEPPPAWPDSAPPADLREPQERPRAEAQPVRFVWRTDAQGRFSMLSDEFAAAVGAPAADVIGRRFREVATAFGFDPAGEVADLLERRDTWSGRSVLWPIAGTELRAPVDLAALPVYNREREFE